MSESPTTDVADHGPASVEVALEALQGLQAMPKTLPPKFFYDERGSELFEQICELPEYYLTRTEIAILRDSIESIADTLGPDVLLIEPGSGAGTKTQLLLKALHDPVGYVPLDISKEALVDSVRRLHDLFPEMNVWPVHADFFATIPLPETSRPPKRKVVFFPGSSIGNFHPEEAREFLGRIADTVGPGGGLLIGADRRKDPDELVAAYDDAQGVTAQFNLNVLAHLNRVCGADFDLEAFEHLARWNDELSRVEIFLISQKEQSAHLAGRKIDFAEGESIHTECAYKYGPEGVAPLTDRFTLKQSWTDADDRFVVQYLEAN